jgi:GTP pyrophosphokinase
VGIGAIENQQQGLRSTKAIVSLIFQNKMKRSPSTADEDIHKPTISSNYDMLVLAKNTINWIISYRLAAYTWR